MIRFFSFSLLTLFNKLLYETGCRWILTFTVNCTADCDDGIDDGVVYYYAEDMDDDRVVDDAVGVKDDDNDEHVESSWRL